MNGAIEVLFGKAEADALREAASVLERESWIATAAIDCLLIAAALIGLALIRRRSPVRSDVSHKSHACGSCGRSYPSRRELKQHQDAVHAPVFLSRSA
jgi:hypothetical protein